jgi:hypothetical protein
MKRVFAVFLVLLSALVLFSCKSTQTTSGASIEGTVTQEKVNEAFEQIYEAFRAELDLTGARNYTVVRGDTLSGIARNFYGSLTGVGDAGPQNGFYFPVIMMASGGNIVDPDLIEPGMQLRIPDLKRNLDNPGARRAIKDALNDVAYVYSRKNSRSVEQGLRKLANSL